jgi:hypothetical protein
MAGTDIVFGYNIRTYAPPPHSNIVAGEAAFISYHLGDAPAEIITAYMRRREALRNGRLFSFMELCDG